MIPLYDVFLSHASEDKDKIARPLAKALKDRGLNVFFDEDAIKLGDNLRRTIDEGLSKSKNGVFILSPNFFKKEWPQKELDVFFAREIYGEKVIIPVWHGLSPQEILKISPTIATHVAVKTEGKSIDEIAIQIIEIVRQRQEDPNIGKISEKVIRIEATRDSIIAKNPISFSGSCINCEGNVHLILHSPGRFEAGREIATIVPNDKNRWSFTLPSEYVEQPGKYSMVARDSQKSIQDDVAFIVEKGGVTIVAAGDQHYYIGEKIRLSGTSLAGKEIYLALKGNSPEIQDRKLDQLNLYSESGNAHSFVKVDVGYDHCWSYEWDTSKVGLQLQKGLYTIFAMETPVTSADRSDESYGSVSIIIEIPFVSATAAYSTIPHGRPLFIRGTAEGNPLQIQIWIFGESFAAVQKVSVNPDSSFKYELSKEQTRDLPPGPYYIVIQHPMMNKIFDVDIDDNSRYVFTYSSGEKVRLFSIQGREKITGMSAAKALVNAINNPLIDDTYTKLQILVEDPKHNTSDMQTQSPKKKTKTTSKKGKNNGLVDSSSLDADPQETTIHVDNSVRYETDKQDFWIFELSAPYLIEKMGKPKLFISGLVSIGIGLVIIIGIIYKFTFPYQSWLGLLFLLIGLFFVAIVKYHSYTQCKKCSKEFAYDEIGVPQVREVTTSDGYIKKTTTRKYKCKFCGHVDTRKQNETIAHHEEEMG